MHKRRTFKWDRFVIPLIGVTRSPARLLLELSNSMRLSRMGVNSRLCQGCGLDRRIMRKSVSPYDCS